MKLRTMLSSLALVSAMSLSGGAFAQAMLGDMEIPADNMGQFQEKCAAIASAAAQSLAEPADDDTATASTTAATDNDSPDLASDDNIEALLASMTPEQCEEAGLLPGGANAARAN